MVQWGYQHRGSDPGTARSSCDCCRERERLAEVTVVELVVLGEPERVDSEPVCFLAQLQRQRMKSRRVLVPPLRVPKIEIEAYLHCLAAFPCGVALVAVDAWGAKTGMAFSSSQS